MAGKRRMKKYILLGIKCWPRALVCGLDWHAPAPPWYPCSPGALSTLSTVPCVLTHLQRPSQGFRHARGHAEAREFFFRRQRCEEGSVRGREAPTHAGNFFLLHVWPSLRRAAWGDEQECQILPNEAAPTPRLARLPPHTSEASICASLIIARFRKGDNERTGKTQREVVAKHADDLRIGLSRRARRGPVLLRLLCRFVVK